MNRIEANRLLDEVKCGKPHPDKLITLALLTTGDLHGKLTSSDSTADSGWTHSSSPTVHHAVVQSPQGEPQ